MLLQVAVPVIVFTAIVLLLTTLVLAARHGFEPGGVVSIVINGKRRLEISAGGRLLASLAEQGIYLPGACGGRGTCGQCRVRVTSGGGVITPTEALSIGPDDVAAGARLACMLRVREPLEVHVPDEVLSVQHYSAVVESSRSIGTYLKEIVLKLDTPMDFAAGDYVLIEAPPHRLDFERIEIGSAYRARWQESRLFDLKSIVREPVTRAYSLANAPTDNGHVVLVVKIALPPPTAPRGTPPGQVSSWLFGLQPGDSISVRGPFGEFNIRDTDREMLLIGGGAGIAPLRSMVLDLLGTGSQRKIGLWYGARDRQELCYADEFDRAAASHANFSYQVALSNEEAGSDWHGHRGLIHAVVLEHYLQDHADPMAIEYYLCGPPVMSAAVSLMLERLGVPKQQIFFDDFGS